MDNITRHQVVVTLSNALEVLLEAQTAPSTLTALQGATQVLARRTALPRITAFHGTASGHGDRVLKSILKKGLVPGAKKAWADDPYASFYTPSRVSYGGIYFSADPRTANSAAGNTVRKFGGVRVIVTAIVQPRSALPDEDDYSFKIQNALGYAVQANINEWLASYYFIRPYLEGTRQEEHRQEEQEQKARFFDVIKNEIERYLAWPRRQKETLAKITDRVFDAAFKRLVSHFSEDYYKRYVINRFLDERGRDADVPPQIREQPKASEAEAEYREAVDALTRATRKVAENLESRGEGAPRFSHTFRIMEGVDYRGRNRITSVVSLPNDNSSRKSGEPIIVVSHYGDPSAIVAYLKSEGYSVIVRKPDEYARDADALR